MLCASKKLSEIPLVDPKGRGALLARIQLPEAKIDAVLEPYPKGPSTQIKCTYPTP